MEELLETKDPVTQRHIPGGVTVLKTLSQFAVGKLQDDINVVIEWRARRKAERGERKGTRIGLPGKQGNEPWRVL